MDDNKKKNIFQLIYVMFFFCLACLMIFYQNNVVIFSIVAIVSIITLGLFSIKNKNHKYFLFFFALVMASNSNDVFALSYTPKEIYSGFNTYFTLENLPLNKPLNYQYYLMVYDKFAPEYKYTLYYSNTAINHNFYYDDKMYYFNASDYCYTKFNDDLDFDLENFDYGCAYGATFLPHNSDGSQHFASPTSPLKDGFFDVYYASEDIIFDFSSSTSVEHYEIYNKEKDDIYNDFGYDLGNVEGYSYFTLEAGKQVVLYPKVSEPFEFYLFFSGVLDVDILDSVGSNIGSFEHLRGASGDKGFWYLKTEYTSIDFLNKRGVYLTNFNKNGASIRIGYDPNLFELLYFNENGIATTEDGSISFNDTYDLIKNENNIIDSNDDLGSFDGILDNASNIAKQFVNVFQVIGQLIFTFFDSMPDFVVGGFQLLFFFGVVYLIIKLIRG